MKKAGRWLAVGVAWWVIAPSATSAEFKIDGKTFTVPQGFVVEKVAGSPLVDRPITGAFDEQGRLYVSDSSGSNDRVQKQLEERPHRIVRLQDTDGDGKYDKSVVFADKMMFPEGTMWLDGSLYVAAPPSIWKLTDTDGDGVADKRVEWFEGKTLTGCANDLHGPYLGPDGWIYWAKGAFAEQTYERPGKSPLVTKAAHIFRAWAGGDKARDIEPVMTGGMDNPVDVVFTPSGERLFTTTFLQHPAGGKRDGIIHAVYGGVWGKVHNVIDGHVRTSPEVMPVLVHLGPAAPCGFHRYESEAFGEEYRDNLFATLFNLRKVTRHVLKPKGATFETKDEDFLVCDSLDFHPTDVIEDADGSLIVMDTGGWYKLCCPTSQIVKPDLLGAVYRVRKVDGRTIRDPRGRDIHWAVLTGAVIANFENPSPAVREQAVSMFRQLKGSRFWEMPKYSGDRSVLVRRTLVRALMPVEDEGVAAHLQAALGDSDETVRHLAVHGLGLRREKSAERALAGLLAKDTPQVQRAVAETLGRIGVRESAPALLEALAKADPADRVMEHSLIYALIEIGEAGPVQKALASADGRVRRAAMIALDQMPGNMLTVEPVAAALTSPDAALRETAAWIAGRHAEWGDALAGTLWAKVATPPASAEERQRIRQQVARLLKGSRALQGMLASQLVDGSVEARVMACEILREAAPWNPSGGIIDSVAVALQRRDPRVIPAALSAIRALSLPKERAGGWGRPLIDVAEYKELPTALRLEAAAAVPKNAVPASPELFAFLTTQLVSELPLPQRLNAADALARALLSSEQVRALSETLKTAGPLELDRVLAAVEHSTDRAVGMELLASLKDAKHLKALPPEAIRRRFAKYPADVVDQAEELIATLAPDSAAQKKKLDEILATLPTGDVRRGQVIFNSDRSACATCHAIGYLGGSVGPDLTKIGSIRQERDLLESIVFPSASFVQTYEPLMVDTKDNDRQYGIPKRNDAEEVVLVTGPNAEVRIPRANVKAMKPGTLSVMPEGFDQNVTRQELADLIAFLKACR